MRDAQNLRKYLQGQFDGARPRLVKLAARLTDEAEAAVDAAAKEFDAMLPELAYRDNPHHPMADSLFACTYNLALFQVLREQGIDAHAFGAAMLEGLAAAPIEPPPPPPPNMPVDGLSGSAAAGEFELTITERSDDHKWGYNITSCAICHQFGKYDAMDLVPYMCATDDLMSDKGHQGLERTGTIALGASRCDFRYELNRPGKHLSTLYPDRIRAVTVG